MATKEVKLQFAQENLDKVNKALEDNNNHLAKATAALREARAKPKPQNELQKELSTVKAELKAVNKEKANLRETLSNQVKLYANLENQLDQVTKELEMTKKRVRCYDRNCTDNTKCGLSHEHKDKIDEVCSYWLKKKCNRGKQCQRNHTDDALTQEQRETYNKHHGKKEKKEEKPKVESPAPAMAQAQALPNIPWQQMMNMGYPQVSPNFFQNPNQNFQNWGAQGQGQSNLVAPGSNLPAPNYQQLAQQLAQQLMQPQAAPSTGTPPPGFEKPAQSEGKKE